MSSVKKTEPNESLADFERRELEILLNKQLPKFLETKESTPLIEHHIRLTDTSSVRWSQLRFLFIVSVSEGFSKRRKITSSAVLAKKSPIYKAFYNSKKFSYNLK